MPENKTDNLLEASTMKALVTTPASPTSLFVVRRLKEVGYKVTVVDSHSRSFVAHSNTVDKRILAPSLRYNPQGFAQTVIDELKKEEYSFYFPVLECGFLMSYYRDIIRQHTKMISMSRSEERRVGKECRSRRSPQHE